MPKNDNTGFTVGPVTNRVVPMNDVPQAVQDFVREMRTSLESCRTFGEFDALAMKEFNGGEHSLGLFRIACAFNLETSGVKVLVQRTQEIYLGYRNDRPVNINTLDTVVASRTFLPVKGSNGYGLLGKIASLRGQTENYYDDEIIVTVDMSEMAYEKNNETGEECYMIKGKVATNSDYILEAVSTDSNILICTAKV